MNVVKLSNELSCTQCNQTDDEFHFFIECEQNKASRDQLISKISDKVILFSTGQYGSPLVPGVHLFLSRYNDLVSRLNDLAISFEQLSISFKRLSISL